MAGSQDGKKTKRKRATATWSSTLIKTFQSKAELDGLGVIVRDYASLATCGIPKMISDKLFGHVTDVEIVASPFKRIYFHDPDDPVNEGFDPFTVRIEGKEVLTLDEESDYAPAPPGKRKSGILSFHNLQEMFPCVTDTIPKPKWNYSTGDKDHSFYRCDPVVFKCTLIDGEHWWKFCEWWNLDKTQTALDLDEEQLDELNWCFRTSFSFEEEDDEEEG